MGIRDTVFLFAAMLSCSASVVRAEHNAVIGTGMMGGALGARLGAAGHTISYGTRDPSQAHIRELVAETGTSARATSHPEAVRAAKIVIIAVPWKALESVAPGLAQHLTLPGEQAPLLAANAPGAPV
jgi:3-hydroxyisobutyrate dehydrogenase-like beta-hydroxyacid dehydrogenase